MAALVSSFPKLINLWSNPVRCLHISTFLSQLRVLKRPVCTAGDYNPLITQSDLPRFHEIKAEHVVPAIEKLTDDFMNDFAEYETHMKEFEVTREAPMDTCWSSVIEPLEKLSQDLSMAWGVVSHLNGVRNSEELRSAYDKVQPLVVKTSLMVSQSVPLYNTLKEIKTNQTGLHEGQKRVVSALLKSARNGGVALERKDKERFRAIQMKLAELGNKFSNNVLDATKSFSIFLTDPDHVRGLPLSLLRMTADAAVQGTSNDNGTLPDPQNGPWKLTLDLPCFEPFMKYSNSRDLREQMYMGMITRASQGATDNSEIIEEIRKLRILGLCKGTV